MTSFLFVRTPDRGRRFTGGLLVVCWCDQLAAVRRSILRPTAVPQDGIQVPHRARAWQATSRVTAQTSVTVTLDASATGPYYAITAHAERAADSVVSELTDRTSSQFVR